MSNDITPIDLYINPQQVTTPQVSGFTPCSPIFDFRAVSSFNGYPVLTGVKPYTIILTSNPGLNCKKIAFFNQTTNKWLVLPGPYISNKTNQTMAAVTNQFSYFVGVTK